MKTKRRAAYFFTSLKLFLREYRLFVLLGCLCLLGGIVVGVLSARSFGEDYYKLNFIFELQSGSYSFAKTFFLALLFGWGGLALILLCGFHRWLIFPAFFSRRLFGLSLGAGFCGLSSTLGRGRRRLRDLLLSPPLSHGGDSLYRLYLHGFFEHMRRLRRLFLRILGQASALQSAAPFSRLCRRRLFQLHSHSSSLQVVFHVSTGVAARALSA